MTRTSDSKWSQKKVLTKFGETELPRRLYQKDKGGEAYIPLDEILGIVNETATIEVREAILFMVAHLSPKDIKACLKKVATFQCSTTAIQNIVNKMGKHLKEHESDLLETVRFVEDLPIAETKCVAVSLDGVNVRLDTPGPKNASPKESETQRGPRRLAGRCVARMPEDKFPTFRQKVEDEVRCAVDKLPPEVVKIVLNDGGTNLWNYVDSNPLYDGFEKLVDFHHVLEHISSGAEGIFGKGISAGRAWYRKMEGVLLSYADGAERVIRSLEYYSSGSRHRPSSATLVSGCLTFMRNNVHRMDYKRFRDNGWPIGSGAVEGACKDVVKQRMCRSGQRWSLSGGQAVLSLRAIVKSSRWEHFWNAYEHHNKPPKLTKLT